MRRLLPIALSIALVSVALAQDSDSTLSFNDAWYAYIEAKDSGKKKPTRDSAKIVLDIARETFEPDDDRLPLLMSNYGTALRESNDWPAAREILEEALDLSEQIHGKGSDEVLPVMMAYADAMAEVRSPSDQDKYYRQALKITAKSHGKSSLEYADVAFRAGVRILEMSKSRIGERYLESALEIYSEIKGSSSEEAGLAAFYLGKIELTDRSWVSATDRFLLALDGLESDKRLQLVTRAFLVQAYEQRGMSDAATEHCLAIGSQSMATPDQDYQPLFRMVPKYPGNMASSGKEGYVDLTFTVDESGFVRDAVVIQSKGGASFEREAIAAVEGFRYAPRFVDGAPVAVDGVKTRIKFRLSSDRGRRR
jgi:TonB family protein